MTCPDEIDDRGRSSNDPCRGYCGTGDFDAWRKTALWDVGLALQRADLDSTTRATLLEWNRMVETMPRPVMYADGEVRMFASIAKQAKCIAMSPASNLPVIVPIRPADQGSSGISAKYWLFAAAAAGLFFYFGGPAWVARTAISRSRRGGK